MDPCEDGPVKFIDAGDVDGHAFTPHPAGHRIELDCSCRIADGSSSKRLAVHSTAAQGDRFVESDIGCETQPVVDATVRNCLKWVEDHAASCSTIAKPGDSTTSGRGYRSVAHASSSDSSIWVASSGNSIAQSPDGTARPPPRPRRVSTTPSRRPICVISVIM